MGGALGWGWWRERLPYPLTGRRSTQQIPPEPSPIEPCWSKIETLLRAKAARTVEVLTDALGPVIDAVTARDARGWFRHCGYALI